MQYGLYFGCMQLHLWPIILKNKKEFIMKKIFVLSIVAAIAFSSCEKNDNAEKSGIFKGTEMTLHNGKAWTWVQLNKEGKPERLAVSINQAALNSVPTDDMPSHEGHSMDDNIVLDLNTKANITPFNHVWLNWNPAGHPPENIYTKPHFDIHFYMESSSEREQYLDPVKLDASPAAEYLPANYFGGEPVPTMGKHYVDLTSPELDPVNPKPFTQTFIYGSYNSKVVFYEPMITLDFLKTTADFTRTIPQPAKYQTSGYYPTQMRVIRRANVVDIILDGFVYRTAS